MKSPQRLQVLLQRAVDAVIQTTRHNGGPDALAACASAEHELAMLQELVHSMRIDRERREVARRDRPSLDRISIH
jgi:hypothetical protein